jgi:hypothetical protein
MWIQFHKPVLLIKRTYGGRYGVENHYSVCRVNDEPLEVLSVSTDEDTLCCEIEIKTPRISEGYRVSYVNVSSMLFSVLE